MSTVKQKYLRDENNEIFSPITNYESVYNSDEVNLFNDIQNIKERLDNYEMIKDKAINASNDNGISLQIQVIDSSYLKHSDKLPVQVTGILSNIGGVNSLFILQFQATGVNLSSSIHCGVNLTEIVQFNSTAAKQCEFIFKVKRYSDLNFECKGVAGGIRLTAKAIN